MRIILRLQLLIDIHSLLTGNILLLELIYIPDTPQDFQMFIIVYRKSAREYSFPHSAKLAIYLNMA
jgi:hypothetical protein